MPSPFLMSEGQHIDHFGNLVWPVYVDFRDPQDRKSVTTLVKGGRAEYAIETSGRILISKPGRFRNCGENLIRDPGEAHASHIEITQESINDSDGLERARMRDQAINRAAELAGSTLQTNTTEVRSTESDTSSYTFGKNGWIFCASIEPNTDDEWETWRQTLEDGYGHVAYIYRPREFARALATMVCEQIGPDGKGAILTHRFEEEPTLRTKHGIQWLFHGPVIYVDDVYSLIDQAATKHELMLLPLFAKARKYQHQREYRFVIWTRLEPPEETLLLSTTMGMMGAMSAQAGEAGGQIMPPVEIAEEEPERFDDELDDEGECDEVTGCESAGSNPRVLDRISPETDGLRAWRLRSSGPSTVVRATVPDADDLPDDFSAMTGTYSSVRALRIKVEEFRASTEHSADEKLRVSGSAWYAEQDIRSLCQEFDDLVCGISISEDYYIVIHVSLAVSPEIQCTLAVAPSGESFLNLVGPRRGSMSPRELRGDLNETGRQVREFVAECAGVSLPSRPSHDNAEKQ